MRDDIARYNEKGVAVLGVSGGSARTHSSFAERLHLPSPLLVDRGLAVAQRYGAVRNFGFIKLVKRTVVGIERDGRIVFYQRGTPSTEEILAAFA